MAEYTEPDSEQISDQTSSELDDGEDSICRRSPPGVSQIQVDQEYTRAHSLYTHNTVSHIIY